MATQEGTYSDRVVTVAECIKKEDKNNDIHSQAKNAGAKARLALIEGDRVAFMFYMDVRAFILEDTP